MAMTDEHKSALAEGRKQARSIRAYLEALVSRRPGRPVTPETLRARLARIEERLAAEADVLKHLDLVQDRIDVAEALEAAQTGADIEALEAAFVAYAKPYGARKGIGYAAWRESGVSAATLKAAEIRQTRNRRSKGE
jgi:5'-deoxynucleotidase YfbR-like HD superfamily hydrolase